MNGDVHFTDLLRQLRDDTTTLVREEVNLAKTEATEKLTVVAKNGAYLAGGALIGFSGLLLVLMSFGYLLRELFRNAGMSEAMATFLGFLIVGAVVAGVAASLVNRAMKSLKGESLAPERTARSLREDKEWVQTKVSS